MTDSSGPFATRQAERGIVVRDLPDPPSNLWRIVGPGVVAAGVGLSSGEFILWPFIASQVGLVFLWGAVLGVVTQFFLNMEIERYTLATGQTAVAGFNQFWKHWGLVLAILAQRNAGARGRSRSGPARYRAAQPALSRGAIAGMGRLLRAAHARAASALRYAARPRRGSPHRRIC